MQNISISRGWRQRRGVPQDEHAHDRFGRVHVPSPVYQADVGHWWSGADVCLRVVLVLIIKWRRGGGGGYVCIYSVSYILNQRIIHRRFWTFVVSHFPLPPHLQNNITKKKKTKTKVKREGEKHYRCVLIIPLHVNKQLFLPTQSGVQAEG